MCLDKARLWSTIRKLFCEIASLNQAISQSQGNRKMNSRFGFLILMNIPIIFIAAFISGHYYTEYASSGAVDPNHPYYYLYSYVVTLMLSWLLFYWLFFLRPHAHDYRSLSLLKKVSRAFAYGQVGNFLAFAFMYLDVFSEIRKQPKPSNDLFWIVFLVQVSTLGLACWLGYNGEEKSKSYESQSQIK